MTDGNAANGVAAAISDDTMASAALAAAAKENERVSSVKATSDDVIEIVRQDAPAAEAQKAPTVQDGTAEQAVGAADEPTQNDPNPDASEEKTIPPNFFQVARFVVSSTAISQDELNEMVKRLVALTKQIRADSGLEQTPSIRVEVLQANGQLVKHEVLYVPEKLGCGYRTTQV